MITRVIENTVKSDGTINSKVRVRSPRKGFAEARAINRSLLYNGYSRAILRKEGVEATITSSSRDKVSPLNNTWLVEVKITGIQ